MSLLNIGKSKADSAPVASGAPGTRPVREVAPLVDIYENPDELLVLADLPGVEPEGLSVHFDAAELRIEGRRADLSDVTYVRTFRVNERIDPNGVSAELAQGVLTVHLKKSAEVKPRKIEVRAA